MIYERPWSSKVVICVERVIDMVHRSKFNVRKVHDMCALSGQHITGTGTMVLGEETSSVTDSIHVRRLLFSGHAHDIAARRGRHVARHGSLSANST